MLVMLLISNGPVAAVMQGKPEEFAGYMKDYANTICGRHPIAVFLHVSHCGPALAVATDSSILFLRSASSFVHKDTSRLYASICKQPVSPAAKSECGMQMLQHCRTSFQIRFRSYDQSSRCVAEDDSSVSYAAAVAVPSA